MLLTDRQTKQQTSATENITSFAKEVTKVHKDESIPGKQPRGRESEYVCGHC